MISKDIIGMNCKQFINYLKEQPACVVEDLLNEVKLPKQMDLIIRLRCIPQNKFRLVDIVNSNITWDLIYKTVVNNIIN